MRSRSTVLYASAVLWCLALLAARAIHTGSGHFLFLGWNLFLAFLPMAASSALSNTRPGTLAALLFALWFLFFPNAPYVVTDLVHLKARLGVPLWYDLLLLLSFAFVSLFAGLQSLAAVHRWLALHYSRAVGWLGVYFVLFLSGFGIYLGRILRWNSWDLITHPFALLPDIVGPVLNPFAHPAAWAFTIGFGSLLSMIYLFTWSLAGTRADGVSATAVERGQAGG